MGKHLDWLLLRSNKKIMDKQFIKDLGLEESNEGTWSGLQQLTSEEFIDSYSPVDGKFIGKVSVTSKENYEKIINQALEASKYWRTVPAPKRGELVRLYGEELRRYKEPLGKLVSYEMGK